MGEIKGKKSATAKDKAISLLKIREHSSEELRRKLRMRGFPSEEIEATISYFIQEDIINDSRFAKLYLDSLIRTKTFGFYGLLAKLQSRGVVRAEAQKLVQENLNLEAEIEIARKFSNRSNAGTGMKLMSQLSRKGFRNEAIRAVAQAGLTD